MKKSVLFRSAHRLAALGAVLMFSHAAIAATPSGLVAYWPLDDIDGLDVVGGHELMPVNLDSSHLIEGRHGQAIRFTGTEYLGAIHDPEAALPIYKQGTYSMTGWVRADGGAANQFFFTMGSTESNDPIFMLGKDQSGNTGQFNPFIRHDTSTVVPHGRMSEGVLFDGIWRHIAWVDDNGFVQVYIDGQVDASDLSYARGTMTINTTAIGALLRATDAVHFQGDVDDVALWQAALTPAQVSALAAGALPTEIDPEGPVITRQPESVSVLLGDPLPAQFRVNVAGTPDFTFQWLKDGVEIEGANEAMLVVDPVMEDDAGTYSVVVTSDLGSATSDPATLNVEFPDPQFPQGLVSYWPLDEIIDDYTPDVVGGHHMTVFDVSESDLIEGRIDGAVRFTGQNYLANAESTPIYAHETYSITAWVRADGGAPDQYFFTMGSTQNNTPIFMLGKDQSGDTGRFNPFIRHDTVTVLSHGRMSEGILFDDNWRHFAWVDDNGVVQVYIDGQPDPADLSYNRGTMTINTTAIGALLRGGPAVHFQGDVDDVAVWRAALTPDQVSALAAGAVPLDVEPDGPVIMRQPEGTSVFLVGEPSVQFSVSVAGTPPFVYQWLRDGEEIEGATEATLVIDPVTEGDAGTYTVVVTSDHGSVSSDPAILEVQLPDPPDPQFPEGLVSYWPLDEIIDGQTPDVVGGHDMTAVGVSEDDLIEGRIGGAVRFTGENYFFNSETIPIYAYGTYSITAWVRADGGAADQYFFTMGSTQNDTPIFMLGKDQSGNTGQFNPYVRHDTATVLTHGRMSERTLFDGNWRHIAWVDDNGFVQVYIDGQLDPADLSYTRGTMSVNTMAIGALLRALPAVHFQGDVDEVAVWRVALTPERVSALAAGARPTEVDRAPLLISSVDLGPGSDQIRLVIQSEFPGREHWVEHKTDLALPEWQQITAEFVDLPEGLIEAVIDLPPGATHFFRVVSAMPEPIFSDDFEGGAPGWTHGGMNSNWELGTPTVGPDAAHSGENVWATGLHDSYPLDAEAWLRSPPIDLSDVSQATLVFWDYRDVDPAQGGIMFHYVQVSVKDAANPDGEPLAVLMTAAGSQSQWIRQSLPLDAEVLGNVVVLEFLLVSDDFTPDPPPGAGWYIDDVMIVPE